MKKKNTYQLSLKLRQLNENQQSIPTILQPKPTISQSPPLALMATLSHDTIHAYNLYKSLYLSPFDINGKG